MKRALRPPPSLPMPGNENINVFHLIVVEMLMFFIPDFGVRWPAELGRRRMDQFCLLYRGDWLEHLI